jgi:hypothetical protein
LAGGRDYKSRQLRWRGRSAPGRELDVLAAAIDRCCTSVRMGVKPGSAIDTANETVTSSVMQGEA